MCISICVYGFVYVCTHAHIVKIDKLIVNIFVQGK